MILAQAIDGSVQTLDTLILRIKFLLLLILEIRPTLIHLDKRQTAIPLQLLHFVLEYAFNTINPLA